MAEPIKFIRTIRKFGGSTSIALPTELLTNMKMNIGDKVEVYRDDSKIIIEKVNP